MDLFANNATSTLAYGINDSDGSLIVTDASSFPTTGNFRILIGTEILLVTGVAGATFTVDRPQEGTVAVSHLAGVVVSHILTAKSMDLANAMLTPQFIGLAGVATTNLAIWQRVGHIRIDPLRTTVTSTYKFRAWLDRTSTGIDVLCQLYDLTLGGAVSGSQLTLGSPDTDLGPKEFEAVVSLTPGSEYEVQLKVSATTTSDQGGISRADVLVTFS